VTETARGAQAGGHGHHGAHQFIGMQAALHQRGSMAFMHQLHRARGRCVAMFGVDQRQFGDIEMRRVGGLADTRLRPNQYRFDDAHIGRIERAFQRIAVTRMGDSHCRRTCRRAAAISLS
jgi:hypothetical protein